jgi:hypothetical protein
MMKKVNQTMWQMPSLSPLGNLWDSGFIHESIGVRQIWQERLQASVQNMQQQVTENILRLV